MSQKSVIHIKQKLRGNPRNFCLYSAAAATAAYGRVIVAAAAISAIVSASAVAREKKRRDNDDPDKAFVIEKIADAVHKVSSCI